MSLWNSFLCIGNRDVGMNPVGKWQPVTPEELKIIMEAVLVLADIQQRECKNLVVENFAAECLGKLLHELVMHKMGFINSGINEGESK